MNIHLEEGFQLHDCSVFPSRNIILRDGEEIHVEPKAMQVLTFLATEPGSVITREQLLEKVWPQTYSGDAALTRCISLLRSSLDDDSHRPRFIETVSKSGYRLVAPVTVFDAPSPGESARGKTRFRLALAGTLLFALLAVLWAIELHTTSDNSSPAVESTPPDLSIAVLPFANMSGDAANDFLSDGVAEEILNRLAQVPSLTVISRSSSFSFRDSAQPIQAIAASLGVGHLLEGSVRKSDDRIRVAVQLIDAGSDALLWSESYDRQLTDLLAIQDEIAHAVVETLRITFNLAEEADSNVSASAYEFLLRGRYLMAQRNQSSLEGAVEAFTRALEIEPDYALAHAELAMTYLLLGRSQYGSLSQTEALRGAQPHADRAMALAPQLAEAQAAAGLVAWRLGEPSKAADLFTNALEINPNYAIVYHWLAMLSYRSLGAHEKAMIASSKARQLDPVSTPISSIYVQLLIARGRLDEAEAELEKVRLTSETNYLRLRGFLDSLDGQWANAVLRNLDAWLLEPGSSRIKRDVLHQFFPLDLMHELQAFEPITSSLFLAYIGRYDEAVALSQARYEEDQLSYYSLFHFATALAHAGDYDQAKPLLEELWEKGERHIALISTGIFSYKQAIMLFTLRERAGDKAGASEILAEILAESKRVRESGATVTRVWNSIDFVEGSALYLSGKRSEGLELMEKAVREGYFIRIHPPLLPELFSDPAFVSLLELQKERQAQEQEKFYAIVCNDNPYRAVWQPSAEGCAGGSIHSISK